LVIAKLGTYSAAGLLWSQPFSDKALNADRFWGGYDYQDVELFLGGPIYNQRRIYDNRQSTWLFSGASDFRPHSG
jgi:hypothetical protein